MGLIDPVSNIASLARVVQDDPEPDFLASHIALHTLASFDCRAVAIGLIKREGFLDLIGTFGLAEKTTSPFIRMPLWTQLPMTEAARTGQSIYINSDDEYLSRYPTMVDSVQFKNATTIATPVLYRNAVIASAAFALMIDPGRSFEKDPLLDATNSLLGLYIRNLTAKSNERIRHSESTIKALTPRQKQIIVLFRDNLTTDQMADRLRYSPSTIKQDIIKIYDLFGVNSREQVIELAEKAGLVEQDLRAK